MNKLHLLLLRMRHTIVLTHPSKSLKMGNRASLFRGEFLIIQNQVHRPREEKNQYFNSHFLKSFQVLKVIHQLGL